MNKFKKIITYVCIISLVLPLISCSGNKDKISDTGFYFDTAITITLYNSNEKILVECFALCEKYENMFSNTIKDSEISQINGNSQSGKYTIVSNETIELIKSGLYYGDLSNGKFDITIGNLSSLWDFSSDSPVVPSDTAIKEYLSHVGYKNVVIDGNNVLLKDSDAKLDLGGIAKGYIADKLKDFLKDNGIKKGIINLGGNVLLIGSRPDNTNYNIGLQKPFGAEDDMIGIVNTNDKSIVTSGIYERYFYENDILYHHILDTETGYPVKNSLLSVTIISDASVDGDGLSTTCFAMGLSDGMNLIENTANVEAVFVDSDYNIHLSSGLTMNDNVISFN